MIEDPQGRTVRPVTGESAVGDGSSRPRNLDTGAGTDHEWRRRVRALTSAAVVSAAWAALMVWPAIHRWTHPHSDLLVVERFTALFLVAWPLVLAWLYWRQRGRLVRAGGDVTSEAHRHAAPRVVLGQTLAMLGLTTQQAGSALPHDGAAIAVMLLGLTVILVGAVLIFRDKRSR